MHLKLVLHTTNGKSHANNVNILFFLVRMTLNRKGTMTNKRGAHGRKEKFYFLISPAFWSRNLPFSFFSKPCKRTTWLPMSWEKEPEDQGTRPGHQPILLAQPSSVTSNFTSTEVTSGPTGSTVTGLGCTLSNRWFNSHSVEKQELKMETTTYQAQPWTLRLALLARPAVNTRGENVPTSHNQSLILQPQSRTFGHFVTQLSISVAKYLGLTMYGEKIIWFTVSEVSAQSCLAPVFWAGSKAARHGKKYMACSGSQKANREILGLGSQHSLQGQTTNFLLLGISS